jgi:hypothetical protein
MHLNSCLFMLLTQFLIHFINIKNMLELHSRTVSCYILNSIVFVLSNTMPIVEMLITSNDMASKAVVLRILFFDRTNQ